MTFGEKLKKLRKEKNLTQEELGKELYVSRAAISSWEVGRTYPDVATLIKISDLFSVSLDILLREDLDMVNTIDKKVKESKKLKKWIISLSVLFVLWVGWTIFNDYFPVFEGYSSFPVSEITNAEIKIKEPPENQELDLDSLNLTSLKYNTETKITLDITLTKKRFHEISLNNARIRGNKAYLPILRKTAIFSDSKEKFDLSDEIDLTKISEIYIVTDSWFPEKDPDEEHLLKIWEK